MAGVEITVYVSDDDGYNDGKILSAFRIEQTTAVPHRFEFELVDELSPPQGTAVTTQSGYTVFADGSKQFRYFGMQTGPNVRAVYDGKKHQIQVKKSQYIQTVSARTVINAIALEHLVAQNNGFLFHCAYINNGGKAILFTAPSGTGKSTQAALWAEHRGAEIVNGDRAAVRLADGVLLAEGIPFAGSSTYCHNKSLPIQAIVYLGQAPKTTIRKLRGYEAFSKIWEGVSVDTWDKTDMDAVSAVVQRAAATLPVYHLACTPDESAVSALEEALRKQECP